jgi:hypothetical protein
MKKVMFFRQPFLFNILAAAILFAFVACNKTENDLPEKANSTSPIVLPKLVKAGPQDSIPEQDSYEYNSQNQLERIKSVNLVTTFFYTNGILTSKKVAAGTAPLFERKYYYQNGNLTSYKEFYPFLADDNYTLFEVLSVDVNGLPSSAKTTSITPNAQTLLRTFTYIWKNGNVVSVDMKSDKCNQSAIMEYDDKTTPWHQFQNPLKNPHFLDGDTYNIASFYSKNNNIKFTSPHCSNTETSYTYNNLGLPTVSKLSLSGNNGFTWSRTYVQQYK